jgi:hypothetical protein
MTVRLGNSSRLVFPTLPSGRFLDQLADGRDAGALLP